RPGLGVRAASPGAAAVSRRRVGALAGRLDVRAGRSLPALSQPASPAGPRAQLRAVHARAPAQESRSELRPARAGRTVPAVPRPPRTGCLAAHACTVRRHVDPAVVAPYFKGAMTDQPDNLVLSILREMRGSLERVEGKLDELVRRVSSVETNLAHVHVELANHSARMDRMDGRLDPIETRLGLGDA